jgi:hypothetical protein
MIELCTIVANENRYLVEWLVHHLLRFDKITIYDNNPLDCNERVDHELASDDVVINYDYRGMKNVMSTIRDRHKYTEPLAIWLDADEFLINVVNKDELLSNFLMSNFDVMHLNWLTYSGKLENTDADLVRQRFKTPVMPIDGRFGYWGQGNRGGKCIFKTTTKRSWRNTHMPEIPYKPCDTDLRALHPANYSFNIKHDKMYIAHYVTKTWEEFQTKINRGTLVDSTLNHYNQVFFNQFNP